MAVKTKWNEDFLKGLQRTMTNRVVLLYSSGIDSTASAILLKEQGYEVFPLFVYYGQTNSEVETKLVVEGATHIGLNPVQIVDVSDVSGLCSSKLIGDVSIDAKDAWLPARNTLFLVLAGMYAQTVDADAISIGYGIYDNFVFGDNMLVHHQLMETLLTFSLARELRVILPIKNLSKKQVIGIVKKYEVLDLTVSCWNARMQGDAVVPCGTCANCIERNIALRELEAEDAMAQSF